VCYQKTRRKRPDAVRRNQCRKNKNIWNIWTRRNNHYYRSTQYTTPTQQCYRQLDVSRQKYKQKQRNEGQHSGENKRKIAREEDAWKIAT